MEVPGASGVAVAVLRALHPGSGAPTGHYAVAPPAAVNGCAREHVADDALSHPSCYAPAREVSKYPPKVSKSSTASY